jgi:hypothetical protein
VAKSCEAVEGIARVGMSSLFVARLHMNLSRVASLSFFDPTLVALAIATMGKNSGHAGKKRRF